MSLRVARGLNVLALVLIVVLAMAWLEKPQNVHIDRVLTRTVIVPAQPTFHAGEDVWVDYDDDGQSLIRGQVRGYQIKDGTLVYAVNMDAFNYPQDETSDELVKIR